MGGTTKFEDALAARLALMRPSRQSVADFISAHPPRLSPGVPDLVARLHARGTRVYLVSGGFRAIIDPIADTLSIPRGNVYANTILFNNTTGEYAGFDTTEFTSKSGGKAAAVQAIRVGLEGGGGATVVAIGDGATDVEARVPGGADVFIGYGGTVVRPTVAAAADWFVMSMEELVAALDE